MIFQSGNKGKVLGSPIHSAKGSTPVLHSTLNTLAAKIIAHITGSPLATVNPMTVKCASLVAALCVADRFESIGKSDLQPGHLLPEMCLTHIRLQRVPTLDELVQIVTYIQKPLLFFHYFPVFIPP